jgi:heme/copper-type cytochrome/quinol oxidase subunit 2
LRQYFLTTQVANTVAAIPITPGGVGTRDATTAAFLSAFDATPADKVGSIPVIMSLVIVFWGLVGAVVFIFSPEARHTAHDAQAHSADDTPPQTPVSPLPWLDGYGPGATRKAGSRL